MMNLMAMRLVRKLSRKRFFNVVMYEYERGTHDDRFWAVALAVFGAEQAEPPPSRPIARVI